MGKLDETVKLILQGTKKAAPKAAPKAAKAKAARPDVPPPLPPRPAKVKSRPRLKPGEYVRDRQRTAYPDIYDRPDEIVRRAVENAAKEDPALFELFGVTRNDLFEMSKSPRTNQSIVKMPENPRGSLAAENVMTPRNKQRITDVLWEAQKYPELSEGMQAWYNMDPALRRLQRISNQPEMAFERFNTYSGMASPGSDVMTELRRGTTARYLDEQGRMDDWLKFGGRPGQPGAPADMAGVPGHPYSSTAHAIPMEHYSRTGEIGIKAPKVPPYIQSSVPAEMGGTWTVPVGDAHWSRAVALADTRRGKDYAASVSTPELSTLMPWWSDISKDVGMQEVPAQALTWGAFSRATGVDTPVGAPKLELLAQSIMRRARELGVDPRVVRDEVLAGRMRLAAPGAIGAGTGLLAMSPEDAQAAETEQYLGEIGQ